eukprot:gene15428-46704_t
MVGGGCPRRGDGGAARRPPRHGPTDAKGTWRQPRHLCAGSDAPGAAAAPPPTALPEQARGPPCGGGVDILHLAADSRHSGTAACALCGTAGEPGALAPALAAPAAPPWTTKYATAPKV